MNKRLLLLFTLIIAQQALSAFAAENDYTQVLFPIEDQWSEGPSFSKEKTHTKENSDYYYYELYPEQILEANHFSLGGLPFDLAMLYPEIDLSDEEFEEEPTLKAPPGGGPPIGGVPLNDGLIFLLIFSVLFISYKLLKDTHIMKASSSRAKREISRSTMELSTSLRPQSGKQSSTKNRKAWIASSFLLAMTLLFCTSNLQAQTLKAQPDNKFVPNNQWYSWAEDGRTDGFDAYTGATINVLENDELGTCTENTITVTITQAPSKGTAIVIGEKDSRGLTKNRILYTVDHDNNKNFIKTGQDVITYEIDCNGTKSEAKVLINISDQPDNIVWEGCFLEPKAMEWGIKLKAQTTENVQAYAQPFAGDLNRDGDIKIVTLNFYNHEYYSNSIYVFNKDLTLDFQIPTPRMYTYVVCPLLLANVDNEDAGEIVIAAEYVKENNNYLINGVATDTRNKLICYTNTGAVKWISSDAIFTIDRTYSAPSLIIADIDGDGTSEILAGDRIFAGETGQLLVTLPVGGRGMRSNMYGQNYTCMPVFADINNDGKLEAVAGNTTYAITINDRTDPSKNKATILAQITQSDGFTSVADIDGDGDLDVVVDPGGKNSLYVWDGATSAQIGNIPDVYAGSRVFLGDITGNGKPEIAFTYGGGMCAFSYDSSTNTFNKLWDKNTSDYSGATAMSMFDFNQDGEVELIYRDETHLRIIDKDGNNITTVACYSGTHSEYPIVVDVDGDGHAEIIVSGSVVSSGHNSKKLLMYASSTSDQWAWARPVWNQHGYNPVYVNDDLSIPKNPMNPTTAFVTKAGEVHRPYNNFLQQATLLNNEGLMFNYGPDLTFDPMEGDYGSGVVYTENGENLDVTIYVLNRGDAEFASPLQISTYKIEGGTYTKVYTKSFTTLVEEGETEIVTFSIPLSDLPPGINPHIGLQLRLNEQDETIPFGAEECRYYNNYYPSGLYSALPAVACKEEDVTLEIYPQDGTYTYKWYATSSSTTVLSETYSYTIEKDDSQIQTLYVDIYQGETKINKDGRYEVKIYLRPKELVWTGAAGNYDWHNTGNWYEPAEVTPKAYLIPRKCTNVLIPDGLSHYPNLSKTTYTTFDEAQCADIRFEFGGEVARTDLLNYDRAFVQYNFGYYEEGKDDIVVKQGFVKKQGTDTYIPSHMARDRYYALSAPLNKIVTGDFGLGGKPNTWQQAFVPTQTPNDTWVGEFKAPANTNDIELNQSLGYAIALWAAGDNNGEMGEDRDLDNGYQSGLDGLEGIIEIPYFENKTASDLHRLHEYDETNKISKFGYYYYQQPDFPQVQGMYGSIARADEAYRFIFDEAVKNKEAFTITVPAVSEIMIGNPTISTMNFDAFYTANSSNIENYYRLFENQVFKTYVPTGDPAKTAPIAPMQAFFIKTKGTIGSTVDLVYPFDASITRVTGAAHGLRSADGGSRIESGMTMQINASQGDYTSQISLVLNEPERKNIEQLFYRYADNTPQLYLKDEAGKRNAVQFEGRAEKEIPLGIQFEKATTVTLNFSNTEDLPLESLSLVDTKTGTETNLLKTSSYTFTHDTDGERFILRVGRLRNVTGIDEFEAEATLNVYPEGKRIVVSSNQSIAAVEVYDTQGRLVIQQTTADGLIINDSGIYIVRVTLANGERKAVKVTL